MSHNELHDALIELAAEVQRIQQSNSKLLKELERWLSGEKQVEEDKP